MSVAVWAAVGLAGGVGAVSRYLVDRAIARRARGLLPWGTFAVNVTGSFAAGLLVGLAAPAGLPDAVRLPLTGGFLGAYTTFSTWTYETLRLAEAGAWRAAAVNASASIIAGPIAALKGLGLALLVSG